MSTTIIGLDLGQTTDPSALTVLEEMPEQGKEAIYALRHFMRFPLGTPYPDIVADVARMCGSRQFCGRTILVVDQTGVGRPVVDMFRRLRIHAALVPITITSGRTVSASSDGSYHVPKKDIVNSLRMLLENGRMRIARKLPGVEVLVRELLDFQARITPAANEVFEACGDGKHDDLVLALAISAWVADSGGDPMDQGPSNRVEKELIGAIEK